LGTLLEHFRLEAGDEERSVPLIPAGSVEYRGLRILEAASIRSDFQTNKGYKSLLPIKVPTGAIIAHPLSFPKEAIAVASPPQRCGEEPGYSDETRKKPAPAKDGSSCVYMAFRTQRPNGV
jgi:hypothetical protein